MYDAMPTHSQVMRTLTAMKSALTTLSIEVVKLTTKVTTLNHEVHVTKKTLSCLEDEIINTKSQSATMDKPELKSLQKLDLLFSESRGSLHISTDDHDCSLPLFGYDTETEGLSPLSIEYEERIRAIDCFDLEAQFGLRNPEEQFQSPSKVYGVDNLMLEHEEEFGSEDAIMIKQFEQEQVHLELPEPSVISVNLPEVQYYTGGDYNFRGHVLEEKSTSTFDTELQEYHRHGISYQPAKEDHDVYRTIQISNLPQAINYGNFFPLIRGGQVVSATITDTLTIIGGKTARVVFLHEDEARSFANHYQKTKLYFLNQAADVFLVATATFPLSQSLYSHIYMHQWTRVMIIHDFASTNIGDNPAQWSHFYWLMCSPTGQRKSAIEYYNYEDAHLVISFTSIEAAISSYEALRTCHKYRGLSIQSLPDPCARPLPTAQDSPIRRVANLAYEAIQLSEAYPPTGEKTYHVSGVLRSPSPATAVDYSAALKQHREILTKQSPSIIIPISTEKRFSESDIRALLKPQNFNWADDDEEEEEMTEAASVPEEPESNVERRRRAQSPSKLRNMVSSVDLEEENSFRS